MPKSQGGIRSFAVAGDFTIGNFTDAKFVRNTGDVRELLTWTKGRHDFTFGYDLELDQSNINNTDFENGNFNFTNDVTGLAMASFMLGYQHTFSQTSGDFSDSRENPTGLFANDKWKVSPRLALDYGLRWEPQQVMKEIWGRIEQFRPDAYAAGVHSTIVPSAPAGLFFIGDKYNGITVPDRGESGDFNNLAPRIGIAWDPTGSGKMSLRAGGGLFFYSRLPGLFLNDASISAPFSLRIDLNDSTTGASQIGPLENPLVNYPSFVSGFPQRFILKNVPKDATFVANPQVFGLQPGVKWVTPEIYDWNITFERQLRADTVMHVSYVGTRGTHLRQDVNLNPGAYTAGSKASLQARRPYQPFGIIYQNRNTGADNYNGLQLDLEKRAVGRQRHSEPDHTARQLHVFQGNGIRAGQQWRNHGYRIEHRVRHVVLRPAAACLRHRTCELRSRAPLGDVVRVESAQTQQIQWAGYATLPAAGNGPVFTPLRRAIR